MSSGHRPESCRAKKSLPRVSVAGRVTKRRSPTWRVIVLPGVGVVGGDAVDGVGTASDCRPDIIA